MLISKDEIIDLGVFADKDIKLIERKLAAIEETIRSYTNNNFQNRKIRFTASSEGRKLNNNHPFLRAGDTVQITEAAANNGLYTIVLTAGDYIEIDRELMPEAHNLVTKVEYPKDVVEGAINLTSWEMENRKKVGVKSESLSRHSITYYDQDVNNQVMGYPVSLMGFLQPYMKARIG